MYSIILFATKNVLRHKTIVSLSTNSEMHLFEQQE